MAYDPSGLLLALDILPVAAAALLIERLFGYPHGLQVWIGHPVQWIGALITLLDKQLNSGGNRQGRGALALFLIAAVTLLATIPLTLFLRQTANGWIIEALLASTILSQNSLETHVRAVARGLAHSLKAGREAVRHIVGRDPQKLDGSGVAKGALESLGENMSDGVLAPLFWLLIAGLPGAMLYKAINTADSMIGHKSEKYLAFGWASARLDDAVNLIPARLTGWLLAFAAFILPGFSGRGSMRAMLRDAPQHLSPNAGWPEAALAGALGIALGGPRSYRGRKVTLSWMGDGRKKLTGKDIEDGLRLYNAGLNVVTALLTAACFISLLAG